MNANSHTAMRKLGKKFMNWDIKNNRTNGYVKNLEKYFAKKRKSGKSIQ